MPDTQLILEPFHDEIYDFCGWCPDCGLEQRGLVVNAMWSCEDCGCEFTFTFKQLEKLSKEEY